VVVPDSLTIDANPKFISNNEYALFNGSDGKARYNHSFSINSQLDRMLFLVRLNSQENIQDKDYNRELYKGTMDVCNVPGGIFGSFFALSVLPEVKKSSNFSFMCPLKPSFYHTTNILLPSTIGDVIIMPRRLKWKIIVLLRGKSSRVKSMMNIFTIKLYGHLT
jgi:Protein of unknown function (DUF1091)